MNPITHALPAVQNWKTFLLRGGALSLFGLVMLLLPDRSLEALVMLFGVFALLDGSVLLLHALGGGGTSAIASGLVGLGLGGAALFAPSTTLTVLFLLIGAWAAVAGTVLVLASLSGDPDGDLSGGWLLLSGALLIALGAVLVVAPGVGALAAAVLIGACALGSGTIQLALGLRMKRRLDDQRVDEDAADAAPRPERELERTAP